LLHFDFSKGQATRLGFYTCLYIIAFMALFSNVLAQEHRKVIQAAKKGSGVCSAGIDGVTRQEEMIPEFSRAVE
jgi:hypothetical protein